MLTKVILDGKFGEVVGQREWMLECDSPAEALALIEANKSGIKNWIRKNIDKYKICKVECELSNGNVESLTNETYVVSRKCKTIRFLPIFTGSGGKNTSVLQSIVGVALVVIGAICENPYIVATGIGMIIGSICTMLMKPSKNDDSDDSGTSYFFNGAANTTQQGVPVPLVFGRCRVGSAVISSAIEVREA